MGELVNSSRRIEKATYVSVRLDSQRPRTGAALIKFAFLRYLALQPGEVDAVRRSLIAQSPRRRSGAQFQNDAALWRIARSFEGSAPAAEMPSPDALKDVPTDHLIAFGRAVTDVRKAARDSLLKPLPSRRTSAGSPAPPGTAISPPQRLADLTNRIHASIVATKNFEANVSATPIGMLNLERLEMRPVGIERGALIATIPLAPEEKTAVVHKEWSVTTKEFTSIVTDSLENYSETGVTENTELSQSVTSQSQHSNQFNVNDTVCGSYPMVTTTVVAGFTAQDQSSVSATASRNHSISVTRKASSRVKQEHKVTISSTTTTGTSETSTRILENPSSTNAIRIDYFSMMRKWHVGLYRYGLRLTYDIAVPEPGAIMRREMAELAELQAEAAAGFDFPLAPSAITADNYLALGDQYKVNVPHYPEPLAALEPGTTFTPGTDKWYFTDISFDVPDGYAVDHLLLHTQIADEPSTNIDFGVMATSFARAHVVGPLIIGQGTIPAERIYDDAGKDFLSGARGHQTVSFFMHYTNPKDPCWIGLTVFLAPSADRVDQWKNDVWTTLFNAAQAAYYANQQQIAARAQALLDRINSVDTLTLRREENEEIMKGALRWLLGPAFDFMPPDVIQLFLAQVPVHVPLPGGGGVSWGQEGTDLVHGVVFTGSELGLSASGWSTMFNYQEMVKFINQAIEWENVIYFLYPYFWDVPISWDFIRQIRHPDAIRQAFLRAGSARIVLTVRKGWEADWIRFVETGGFGSTLVPNHPYLSIATEIANYDETNYPGIPPANPGATTAPDAESYAATVSGATLKATAANVTIPVSSTSGFQAGYTAVIDSYDSGVQETQAIVSVPDPTHLVVVALTNAHDGSTTPFAIRQAGEKGLLIAEWFEYTPTSGTDIAVTSDLTKEA